MSQDLNPPCPIAARFLEDLRLSGSKPRNQQAYVRAIRKFTEFLGHWPDQATEDQLRKYLLHLRDSRKLAPSTINVAQQALKRFFRITCPRDWPVLKLAHVQTELKLPVGISVDEVHTLLKMIEKPSMRCFFTVVYAMGLRLQEAINLQATDIDSKQWLSLPKRSVI